MERLIDEIVDNKDNRMSNRGKFRALPVTNKHRKQIEELEGVRVVIGGGEEGENIEESGE